MATTNAAPRWHQRVLRSWASHWKQHLATLLAAWALVAAVDHWRMRDLPRGPAPDAPITLANGVRTTLHAWRTAHPGQPVALHFWAEWCAICQLEEPAIAALSHDWPVLGIAMQSGPAARVAQVQQQRGLPWPTAVDPQAELSRQWGVRSVPALVVIDSQGQVRFTTSGFTPEWAMRLRLWWAKTMPSA